VRILVAPPTLGFGGSQMNAIELGAAVRDLGHDVTVVAQPGPLGGRVAELRLPFVPLRPTAGPGPSWPATAALGRLARERRIDLVHAYESAKGIEAAVGARTLAGVPVLTSIMSMTVPERFPAALPLVLGTRQMADDARAARGQHGGTVALLEPPIDTREFHPEVDGSAFRREHDLEGCTLLVVVSRLSAEMKLEGVARSIEAVALLPAADPPVRLAIVGGGNAYGQLQEQADAVNARLGRRAVVLTGPLLDPRPAYAAADVVIGMGGSILRGMSTGRPALCLGEQGFSKPVLPETIDWFLEHGFYGLGDGDADPGPLAKQLADLLDLSEQQRRELGAFSRSVVVDGFDLQASARRLVELYQQVIAETPGGLAAFADGARAARWMLLIKAKQRALALRGRTRSAHR
jgi:glycosyltransferase involved in cell wall biosynthesis